MNKTKYLIIFAMLFCFFGNAQTDLSIDSVSYFDHPTKENLKGIQFKINSKFNDWKNKSLKLKINLNNNKIEKAIFDYRANPENGKFSFYESYYSGIYQYSVKVIEGENKDLKIVIVGYNFNRICEIEPTIIFNEENTIIKPIKVKNCE